jgi:hypothetical protein
LARGAIICGSGYRRNAKRQQRGGHTQNMAKHGMPPTNNKRQITNDICSDACALPAPRITTVLVASEISLVDAAAGLAL